MCKSSFRNEGDNESNCDGAESKLISKSSTSVTHPSFDARPLHERIHYFSKHLL